MAIPTQARSFDAVRRFGTLALPSMWLIGVAAVLLVVLTQRIRLPVGGYYWDVDLYLNAAHRFALGQIPHVDYFSQVGSLSLALYAGIQRVFPAAHPVLAAQWSILIIVLPMMWLPLRDIESRSWLHAVLLAGPLAFFAVLPYNINEYFLSNAPDAYGIYNRQAGLVLYGLTTCLIWSERPAVQAVACGLALCVLAFVKITALFPALAFIVYAALAGRLRPWALRRPQARSSCWRWFSRRASGSPPAT